MKTFIDEIEIQNILEKNKEPDHILVRETIEKAKNLTGLTPEDSAILLQCPDKELIEYIYETASYIKETIYGNRLVLFAPLYLTNICVNNCLYCGFRRDNTKLQRKKLTMEEIKREVEILEKQGHKRLLLVCGEDLKTSNMDYIENAIKTIYRTKRGGEEIRRINVNIAPLSLKDFKRLKNTGIGTYQLFQETYHKGTYKNVHPCGPKANYEWRLFAMDRAIVSGIDDVGIGVLFGIYDYKFEVLSLLYHCLHLEWRFGIGPHTISVPRIKPALNAPAANRIPYPVPDENFKKIVAIIRLAVPYTGIILSTRESQPFRDEIFSLGVSQISAGSRANPGGYSKEETLSKSGQFSLEDTRTQLEIVKDIMQKGFFPSFCTACYRTGRTGKDFMSLAKPGDIKNFCAPNSILTFKEYILDYGDEELKEEAKSAIQRELNKIGDGVIKQKTIEKMEKLEKGERDFYF